MGGSSRRNRPRRAWGPTGIDVDRNVTDLREVEKYCWAASRFRFVHPFEVLRCPMFPPFQLAAWMNSPEFVSRTDHGTCRSYSSPGVVPTMRLTLSRSISTFVPVKVGVEAFPKETGKSNFAAPSVVSVSRSVAPSTVVMFLAPVVHLQGQAVVEDQAGSGGQALNGQIEGNGRVRRPIVLQAIVGLQWITGIDPGPTEEPGPRRHRTVHGHLRGCGERLPVGNRLRQVNDDRHTDAVGPAVALIEAHMNRSAARRRR